jgi:nucleoside-diphosphate-sugar epimerase
VRSPARAAGLAEAGCELVSGDLDNREALTALVADTDCVVHLAGAVRGACYDDFHRANVAGSRNLFLAIAGAPVPPRLLFLSSLAAREPRLSWYARSKHEAERALAETAVPGQAWTVLRPPAVYGPGDRELLPLFRTMARGLAPLPGSAGARVSLLHVDDLVTACLACLASDGARGEILALHDGRRGGYGWRDIADTVAALRGRPVRLLPLPRLLLDLVAGSNLLAARSLRRAPMLTPSKLRELRHPDWVADNAAIRAATGWHPAIELTGGLATLPGMAR